MAELKKCPFCGGEAKINYERIPGEDKGYWAQVICQTCHGRSAGIWAGSYNAAERNQVKEWNNRATEAEIRAKAIDEFAEKLKKEAYDKEYNVWTKDTMISIWESTIEEIAEQLKGE